MTQLRTRCDTLARLHRGVTHGGVKETLRNFTVFRAALYKKALSSKFTVVLLFSENEELSLNIETTFAKVG